MFMKEVVSFLFSQIGEDKIFRSTDIDGQLVNLKNDFIELHDIPSDKMNTIKNNIVDTYRMLFYQNGNRRHYGFSTLVGDTANLITDEVILDRHVSPNDGIIFYTPDPYFLSEKGFTRESFISFSEKIYTWKSKKKIQKRIDTLASFKSVVGYFVYTNKSGEANILDLTNQVITLYKDTDRELDKMVIKHIMKSPYGEDEFLCSTFNNDEDIQHYWYMTKDLILKTEINKQIYETLGHWDFKIYPGSYDIFVIWENNKSHLYSVKYNLIYNTFEGHWRIINVLNSNPDDYNKRTIVLLHNHDMEKEDEKDIDTLGMAPLNPNKTEEMGKYVEIPTDNAKSIKQIIGSDVLYTVVNNPEYFELTEDEQESTHLEPYIFSMMYMNDEDVFTLTELPASSIPISIYLDKAHGVMTFIYKQNVFYNVVSFFKEAFTEYKYSYMEVSTQGVREAKNRKLTEKHLLDVKKHLLSTSTHNKSSEEEYRQLHTFHKIRVEEEEASTDPIDDNPILASSYFIDMTNMEVDYGVERLLLTTNGKFVDIKYSDKSISSKMRYQTPLSDFQKELDALSDDREWLMEQLKK